MVEHLLKKFPSAVSLCAIAATREGEVVFVKDSPYTLKSSLAGPVLNSSLQLYLEIKFFFAISVMERPVLRGMSRPMILACLRFLVLYYTTINSVHSRQPFWRKHRKKVLSSLAYRYILPDSPFLFGLTFMSIKPLPQRCHTLFHLVYMYIGRCLPI